MNIFTQLLLAIANITGMTTGESETLVNNWCENQYWNTGRIEASYEVCSDTWENTFGY